MSFRGLFIASVLAAVLAWPGWTPEARAGKTRSSAGLLEIVCACPSGAPAGPTVKWIVNRLYVKLDLDLRDPRFNKDFLNRISGAVRKKPF